MYVLIKCCTDRGGDKQLNWSELLESIFHNLRNKGPGIK
jgi:hypothetical protein